MEENNCSSYLERYSLKFPKEKEKLKKLKAFLDENSKDLYDRKNENGHITSSGVVISNDSILLIFHPYLKKWLLPGGHIDFDEDPVESAIREVLEETGYTTYCRDGLNFPVDIDIHTIAENTVKNENKHTHFDLRFILELKSDEKLYSELTYKWVPFSEIEDENLIMIIDKYNSFIY